MNHRHRAAIALLSATLGGCATAPSTPPAPTVPLPAHPAPAASTQAASTQAPSTQATPPQWWRLYREPALEALVQEALRDNRDLRAAAARLLLARALLEETRGQRLPTTDLSAGAGYGSTLQDQIAAAASHGDTIRTGSRLDLGAGLSWELDLSGRLRATVAAARADAREAQALADGIKVIVATDVTQALLSACGEAQRLELARATLGLAQAARQATGAMRSAGLALPVDVMRADLLVAQAQAALPPLEARRQAALAQLAVLTGHPPEDSPPAARACARLPAIAALPAPAEAWSLLRRRPELRAAEQRLAASTARIGVAVADLYPRVTLGLGGASSSPGVAGLIDSGNLVWRAGPLLSWSFPDTRRARARIRQARADEIATLAGFDAAILGALKEVNQAAQDHRAALDRQAALARAAQAATSAEAAMRDRQAAGAATRPEALAEARKAALAREALAAADLDVATAQVTLFKALGGGWEDAPPVSLPSPIPSRARKVIRHD